MSHCTHLPQELDDEAIVRVYGSDEAFVAISDRIVPMEPPREAFEMLELLVAAHFIFGFVYDGRNSEFCKFAQISIFNIRKDNGVSTRLLAVTSKRLQGLGLM
jgi:hypothetical protein